MRPSWDDYFIGIARAVAARADCTRRKVGAVIVDENRRIIATGYNGALSGEPGCLTAGACPRGRQSYEKFPVSNAAYEPGQPGFCIAVHAEENALLENSRDINQGCILYCTDEPCHRCMQLAWSARIAMVITPTEVISQNVRYPRWSEEEESVNG